MADRRPSRPNKASKSRRKARTLLLVQVLNVTGGSTTINSFSTSATPPLGAAGSNLGVLLAQSNNPTSGGNHDRDLAGPVKAADPSGLVRQATLTERVYNGYGETRYYVNGVPLPQSIKNETAARAEVARRIGMGTMGALPLAAEHKPAEQTRTKPLRGTDGIVRALPRAGNNTVVELAVREELRNGRWQVTGYIATKVSIFSIESTATSQPRTADGYPLGSQTRNTLIRTANGGVITDLAQAHRRTPELVAAGALTALSTADAGEVAGATRLPRAIGAMNPTDRVQYLLQEAVKRLPASVGAEVKAMLTSPETLVIMGAFCAAQAVPGLNVAALVVGTLLLGNDILDTGGKMVDAVKLALSASSHAELVSASRSLSEALAHGAVSVGSAALGSWAGKGLKNATSAEATSLRTLGRTVENYRSGRATPEQVRRAAIVAMQEKRASNANANAKANAGTDGAAASPQATTRSPALKSEAPDKAASNPSKSTGRTASEIAVAEAAAAQRAIAKASEGVFTDKSLQAQLADRLVKDPRTNPSENSAAAIDPRVVQTSAAQLFMPKLLQAVFGGRNITKNAADAFTARATAWARQESPSNPAGALERLAALPVSRAAMVRQTVIDQLTGSSVASMKVLGSNQPMAAHALSARRQRLADAIDRAYPNAQSQAGLLQPNAGNARAALLRQQVGAELGGSTPLARAVEAQLKAKGTGERDLVNLSSSPQARISAMKSALVEQWRGSSGKEPLLDGKSQRALGKAIDSQLAGIPGALAKEQHLKDLAASGQKVSRMAHGEGDGGTSVRKTPRRPTTISEQPPSVELANKSRVPSSLKSVPGGFEINVAGLTAKQRVNYQRLRASDLTAVEIDDITSIMMRSGVAGLAKNPKFLNLSADNLACLMHLINGLDSMTSMHDVTHAVLTNPRFNYGTSEWRENVGNTVANSFIVRPNKAFEPFSWVTGANGQKTLRIDTAELASARKALNAQSGRFSDTAFENNFATNSRNRTKAAVERSVFEITYMEGRGGAERYQQFRAQMQANGQLPDSPAANFEQKLARAYADFEAKVLGAEGPISESHEWVSALEPIVRVLSEPAIEAYRRVPAATRRELAVDSIASVLTAAKFNPKVAIPRASDVERFSREWIDMATAGMKQPGYLKTYLEVRAQVRKAMTDEPKP